MKFVSNFLDEPVPSESFWMTRYFRGPMGYEFLRYFLFFRTEVHFPDHVGRPCSKRWSKRMKSRLLRLESSHAAAKRDMDFELLAEIEMGDFKLH
jgi:hypothetical protein